MHLFQSEAAWKPAPEIRKPHSAASRKRKETDQFQIGPLEKQVVASQGIFLDSLIPNCRSMMTNLPKLKSPKRRALMAKFPKLKSHHRLSTVTLLRAFENSILINKQGHFPDERELESLKTTSKGLRCVHSLNLMRCPSRRKFHT